MKAVHSKDGADLVKGATDVGAALQVKAYSVDNHTALKVGPTPTPISAQSAYFSGTSRLQR